jgi:hypothetical protein
MTKIFRAMKRAKDGRPLAGDSRRYLGVSTELHGDIAVDDEGVVHPGSEGMSVAPYSPIYLPPSKVPPQLGGEICVDPVWEIEDTILGEGLVFVPDEESERPYGVVAPAYPMEIGEYRDALATTRHDWREWDDEDYSRELGGANP